MAFAAIGDRLDMPYRHLSSGMKARLGFSVITQLDEPIVFVDEVLAVGDAKFKRKCYRRMEEMLADGRTLFLVSHNERELKRFCTRGLYLKEGELVMDGQYRGGRLDLRRRHELLNEAFTLAVAGTFSIVGERTPGSARRGGVVDVERSTTCWPESVRMPWSDPM